MKIALFNYSSSGLFHYACSLANSLIELKQSPSVYFFTSKRNKLSLLKQSPRLSIIASSAPHGSIRSLLRWAIDIPEHLNNVSQLGLIQPDIIHFTDVYPVYPLYRSALAVAPKILTLHDPITHTGERWALPTRLIQRYLISQSKRVIIHSEKLKRGFDKASVIPMGDFSILGRNDEQTKIPRSILFFGRIAYYKGLDTLLESLLMLQNGGSTFHLVIAGAGDLRKYQSLIDKIHTKSVLNYYIAEEDVGDIFNSCELIVLPYHEATQSAVAMLALSAGVPIIATKVGALPDILRDRENSLLIEPRNPANLMKAINELLNDHNLQRQLVSNGFETVKSASWPIIAAKHYDLYQSVI